MPLPKPIYPSYVPRSFITQELAANTRLAMELYGKYHPGAMQQALYQQILNDEQFQAKQASEKAKILYEERDRSLGVLARFRETGLGPSGRTGAGSSGFARGSQGRRGAGVGDWVDATKHSYEHMDRVAKNGIVAAQETREEYAVPPYIHSWVNQIIYPLSQGSAPPTPAAVAEETRKAHALLISKLSKPLTSAQKKVAMTYAFSKLEEAFPEVMRRDPTTGELARTARDIMKSVAYASGMEGQASFVQDSLKSGIHPWTVLENEKNAMMAAGAPGGESWQEKELKRYAGKTPDEITELRAAESARRAALGIPEPLSQEEQAFLGRYIEALSDDGIATREELGDDFDAATAAYERGRTAERLHRGVSVFYDQSYLRELANLARVNEQIGAIEDAPSPGVSAARRTLDATGSRGAALPYVPPEVLAQAAKQSSMLAEVLPYALRRVSDEPGESVSPRDEVEAFAQSWIDQNQGAMDHNSLVDVLNKKYPNSSDRRRRAYSYIGAANYKRQAKTQTLDPGFIENRFDDGAF